MAVRELNLKVNLTYGDDYIQDQNNTVLKLMFIFWGIILPIIGVVGVVGNVLTIVVLFTREMKSTTVYFLRTLVVTDTAIIVGAILGLSVISITQLDKDKWLFTDVIYPHIFTPMNYLVMALQMLNVWTTVAVSVERYVAICHPFKALKICKKRYAYITIGIVTFISILYNIPRCFATTFVNCGDNCYAVVTTDFGDTKFYKEIYSEWLYMILVYIIPLSLLIVLNTLLILELMRMRRRRIPGNSDQQSEVNMSVILVMIVIVFVCCQTPGLVAQFQFWDAVTLMTWTCVSNTLFVLNSSVNFLIYTAVGKKFRNILIKICKSLMKGEMPKFQRPRSRSRQFSQSRVTELTSLTSDT